MTTARNYNGLTANFADDALDTATSVCVHDVVKLESPLPVEPKRRRIIAYVNTRKPTKAEIAAAEAWLRHRDVWDRIGGV